MKTYKVVNRFHDAQSGYVLRKVGEKIKLSDERGEELTKKKFVELIPAPAKPEKPVTKEEKNV